MALTFPTGEAPGQTYTEGNRSWVYDGTKWNREVKNLQKATVSDTAPTSPSDGQRWMNSSTGKFYFYKDGNWVQAQIL